MTDQSPAVKYVYNTVTALRLYVGSSMLTRNEYKPSKLASVSFVL